MVKNLPTSAGDISLISDLGSSHVPQSSEAHAPQLLSQRSRAGEPLRLSPRAATTEACMPLGPVLRNKRCHRDQKPLLPS